MKVDRYQVNGKHRTNAAKEDRTQWDVSTFHEIKLFAEAQMNGWICDNNKTIWAIEFINDEYTTLGNNGESEARLAKYIVDHNNEWHGYPVSTERNGDRPPSEILDKWISRNIISKSVRRKIQQGKW